MIRKPLTPLKNKHLERQSHEGLVQIYKFPFFQDLPWISFRLSSRFIFQGKKIGSSRNLQGLMTTSAKTKTSFLLLDAQLPTKISLLWTRDSAGPPNSSPFCALVPNSYGRSLGRNISTVSCWFTEGCLNPTFFHESMHQTLDIPYPSLKSTQTAKLVNAATEPYFKTEVISMTSHRFHKF